MTRDMTITVQCDGRGCDEEREVDLDSGCVFDDYDIRIEKSLEEAGWYTNLNGDYCPKCAQEAKEKWNKS